MTALCSGVQPFCARSTCGREAGTRREGGVRQRLEHAASHCTPGAGRGGAVGGLGREAARAVQCSLPPSSTSGTPHITPYHRHQPSASPPSPPSGQPSRHLWAHSRAKRPADASNTWAYSTSNHQPPAAIYQTAARTNLVLELLVGLPLAQRLGHLGAVGRVAANPRKSLKGWRRQGQAAQVEGGGEEEVVVVRVHVCWGAGLGVRSGRSDHPAWCGKPSTGKPGWLL